MIKKLILSTLVLSFIILCTLNSHNTLAVWTDMINVKSPPSNLVGAKGDGVKDDTLAIQKIINSCRWGDTVYFPKGTYIVKGLTIPVAINIVGYSKTSTIIKNISTTNPCIKIMKTRERIRINDIGIWGNGTKAYGTDATSSYGIELDGCVLINIDNIWMRGHGNHSIYATDTNVNNINISNSEIEYGKGDGINILSKDKQCQKNAISISNCNIAGFSRNGISIWGNSINIHDNTIQVNKGVGISIDSDLIDSSFTACGISITENYFEICSKGFIKVKADADKGYTKLIIGLWIERNFGNLYASQVDASTKALVSIENPNHKPGSSLVRNLKYDNSFSTDTLNVLDANNCLSSESTISIPYCEIPMELASYKNLGTSKIEYLKSQVLNGYFNAKGVDYNISTGKSNNITSNTTIYFPCEMGSFNNLRNFEVLCETDSTNYSIKVELMRRDKNTNNVYVSSVIGERTNLNRSKVFSPDQSSINITTNNINIDMYYKITITFKNVGKYFYLGNPAIEMTQ